MHEQGIYGMFPTKDNEFLFTGGYNKDLKQIQIKTNQIVSIYENTFDGHLSSIALTENDRYMYTIGRGMLKKWCLKTQRLVKDYGKISDCNLRSVSVSGNDDSLFLADGKGRMISWDGKKEKVYKNDESFLANLVQSESLSTLHFN